MQFLPDTRKLSLMATRTIVHKDGWGHEREGYFEERVVSYAPAKAKSASSGIPWAWIEERLGALGVGGAVIWGVQVATTHIANRAAFWETPGPIEACGFSFLIWLHAKWRRSVHLR